MDICLLSCDVLLFLDHLFREFCCFKERNLLCLLSLFPSSHICEIWIFHWISKCSLTVILLVPFSTLPQYFIVLSYSILPQLLLSLTEALSAVDFYIPPLPWIGGRIFSYRTEFGQAGKLAVRPALEAYRKKILCCWIGRRRKWIFLQITVVRKDS